MVAAMGRDFRALIIEQKAGLIKPGKPSLMSRIKFLGRSMRDDRGSKVGVYLESRRRGGGFGKFGKAGNIKRPRKGTYNNVYTNRTK